MNKKEIIIIIIIIISIIILTNNNYKKIKAISQKNLKNTNATIITVSKKNNSEIGYKTENKVDGSCNVAIGTKEENNKLK